MAGADAARRGSARHPLWDLTLAQALNVLDVLYADWDRDLEQTARLRALTSGGGDEPDSITDEETMNRARSLVALAVG